METKKKSRQSRGPPQHPCRTQVEQEQIQKRTFTNWINAQLSKRKPPCVVLDLFYDFRDGARLLDLLEVMSGQRLNRERGRGMFQHRSNIEMALSFLKKKSIKLVNINVPDIIDGKPSIILGLIWTIILHFHIEELACALSFSSRQSSLESLASLDTISSALSSGGGSSARSSPLPHHTGTGPGHAPSPSPLHQRFRISAKKALLLWVREQCHKAGCTLSVKDFKVSWRSGVVFLAILSALRPGLVDLTRARTRTNRQNLEEAFRIAEKELHIPRLLDPADVDVREPDEKSIMTYVAQFLQYSKDMPVSEEEMSVTCMTPSPPKCVSPLNLPSNFTPAISTSPYRQTSANQKAQEVTYWLEQAYQELLEGWDSTEGESYAERYHVFQTFIVSFNEQRRPVMPLLTAMKRTTKLSEEQKGLRAAWDSLAEKLREYKTELDLSLPPPLDTVGRWLLRAEAALSDQEADSQDHARVAEEAREKMDQLKACLEEMSHHMKTFQMFQNVDEYGGELIPSDKLEEIKRRFTSVRVTSKYHGIRLDYQELRHTALHLLGQINTKLNTWKRAYISQEAVRVLLQDWQETVGKQELVSQLEGVLVKLKNIASKYSTKSALAGEVNLVSQQMKKLQADSAIAMEAVTAVKGTMGRVLSAFDSFMDLHSSLLAWLEQGTQRAEVTAEVLSEWGCRQARLNQVGSYLLEVTDPQTSHALTEELRRVNLHWDEHVRRVQLVGGAQPAEQPVEEVRPQTLQVLLREATQLLKEPLDVMSAPLRTYRKRLQFMMMKIKEVDMDGLSPSPEFPAEMLQKFKQAMPEVLQTLCEAMQVCEELQQSVCGLESRLAELLLWETEAREIYQLLKHKYKGQDPRSRELISRGLQLEGQVVTEEQDLQAMVMAGQKNSPLQYLIASSVQERVRHAVSQSQEVVGLLSSLGSRRDHRDQPPPKVIQSQAEAEATAPTPAQPSNRLEQPDSSILPQAKPQDEAQISGPTPLSPLALPVPQIIVQELKDEVSHPHPEKESTPTASEPQGPPVPQAQPPVTHTQPPGDPQTQTSVRPKSRTRPQGQAAARVGTHDQTPGVVLDKRPPQPPRQPPQTPQDHQGHMPPQPPLQPAPQPPPTQQSAAALTDIKARKAQARQNRPWLQPKAQSSSQAAPAKPEEPKARSEVSAKDGRDSAASEASDQSLGQTQPQPQAVSQKETQAKSQPQPKTKIQPEQSIQSQTQEQTKISGQQLVQCQTQQQAKIQGQQVVFSQTQQVASQTKQQAKGQPQPPVASQTQSQTKSQPQPPVASQTQPQTKSQPQPPVASQTQPQTKSQPQPTVASQTQPQTKSQPQPPVASQTQSQTKSQPQPPVASQTQLQARSQPQTPVASQTQPQTKSQPQQTQLQAQSQIQQIQLQIDCQSQPPVASQTQPQVKSQPQLPIVSQTQSQIKKKTQPPHTSKPQAPVTVPTQPAVGPSQLPVQIQQPVAVQDQQQQTKIRKPQAVPKRPPQPGAAQTPSVAHAKTQALASSLPQAKAVGPYQAESLSGPQPRVQPTVQTQAPMVPVQPQVMTPKQPLQDSAQATLHHYPLAYPPRQGLTATPLQPKPSSPIQPRIISMPPMHSQAPVQPQPQHSAAPQHSPQPPSCPRPPHPAPQQSTPHLSPVQPQPQQWGPLKSGVVAQSYPNPQTRAPVPTQMSPMRQYLPYPQQPPPQAPPPPQQNQWASMRPGVVTQTYPRPQTPTEAPVQVSPYPQAQAQPTPPQQQWVPMRPDLMPQTYPQPMPPVQAVSPQPWSPVMPLGGYPKPQAPGYTSLQGPGQYQTPPPSPHPPQWMPIKQPEAFPQSSVQTKVQQPAQQMVQHQQWVQHSTHIPTPVQSPTQIPTPVSGLVQMQTPRPIHPQAPVTAPPVPAQQPIPITARAPAPVQTAAPMHMPVPEPAQKPTPIQTPTPVQPLAPVQMPAPKPTPTTATTQAPVSVQQPIQTQAPGLEQPSNQTPTQVPAPGRPQGQLAEQPGLRPQSWGPPQAESPSQAIAPQAPAPQSLQAQSQPQAQMQELPQGQAGLRVKAPGLAQAPPQAYTEAYTKAQALARNRFEEAKHCLQEHILEAITLFRDTQLTEEQALAKEEMLRSLDPEMLEEFLRAAEGMEAFCTPSQLRDMEFFTQSVRTQWEEVRAAMAVYVKQLRFEINRRRFNSVVLVCEMYFNTQGPKRTSVPKGQACFSVEGSVAQAGRELQGLKELCDTLSPEDAHRLAQAQLRECEKRLAAIQHQFSSETDTPPPETESTEKSEPRPQTISQLEAPPQPQAQAPPQSQAPPQPQAQAPPQSQAPPQPQSQAPPQTQVPPQPQAQTQPQSQTSPQSQSQAHPQPQTPPQSPPQPQSRPVAPVETPPSMASPEASPAIRKSKTVQKREIVKQMSAEDEAAKEAMERYRSARFALVAQLNRNEQSMVGDLPSDTTTTKDLQKRHKELQALTEESELLWSEFARQCSQLRGQDRGVEQDQVELALKWREQKTHLQNRVTSLGSALQLVDSTERSITEISDRLDCYIKEPKDIIAYTLTNSNTLKDIKDLDESIQVEMDRLSRFDSDPSHLDLRDRAPLTQVVLSHRASLDRLRQQVRKSEAAARALDRFLMSLRTVDQDIGAMQSTPSGNPVVLQEGRAKLEQMRPGVESLAEKAPQLDRLLEGGQLSVTCGGVAASCLDMASMLLKALEQADGHLVSRQQDIQKAQQSQGLTRRRSTLAGQLRRFLSSAEKQGLQEPTIPAVQQRIRALQELEAQLLSLQPEYHSLREASAHEEQTEHAYKEMDTLWKDTQRAVTDRQEQCSVLMELLKKFQNCRSYLANVLQRAEHTINEQASYIGKDNLQRLITTVHGIKDELSGLGAKMEEIRAVCRQLQSHLKKIPDCKETPFEAEADALVDTWLDVTEKTDSYIDNLCVGLELWEKQLMLGGEIDTWAAAKMAIFAESHPFQSEQQVMDVKAEIKAQEEIIERFHKKTLEIQQLLQSKEEPLELQVMETGLKKRMEQVKELFADTTDVFQELQAVRRHLTQKMADCHTSVQKIQTALSMLSTTGNPQLQTQIQELQEQLQEQEETLSSLQKEVGVMASVAGPEVLEALREDSNTLRESIASTHLLLQEAGQQCERSLMRAIKDECQAFEEWFQDLQMSVNECFESPERQQDVETALKRLTSFLSCKDGEQRLAQLRKQVEGSAEERLGLEPQAQLQVLLQEQQDELDTFRAHCQDRLVLLQDILQNISSMQKEHDYFRDWLQQREDRAQTSKKLKQQHKEFLSLRERAEAFSSLLSSTQRCGLRGDTLLTDSQALLERYHSLGAHLDQQAHEQAALLGEVQDLLVQLDTTTFWVREMRQGLDTLDKDASPEDRCNKAQSVLSQRCEGDSKLSSLRARVESVCERCENMGVEEEMSHMLPQVLGDTEEQWRAALQVAEEAHSQAKLHDSLSVELAQLSTQQESTLAWVRQLQQGLDRLHTHTPMKERLSTAQLVLLQRGEGDSKLSSLRAQVESVCERCEGENIGEERRRTLLQAVGSTEDQWRAVLQAAEEAHSQAELQDSLSRELAQLSAQQESTLAWVHQLQQGLDAHARGTHGSPEHLEERYNRAQAVLNVKSEGNGKLASLKKSVESVCAREDLEESRRRGLLKSLRDTDLEWREVLRAAQEQHSVLKRVVERIVSCQYQKQQTQDRLDQLRCQTDELPRRFPWPGLGERRHAAEQARGLLDRTRTLAPSLAGLRAMGRELYQITHDPGWTDPSWAAMEESVPGLLLELTELIKTLEEGILTEGMCVQLVEQHSAAQDWLREQVKGLPAPPTDRQGLQASINTLKALLQTVDREQRELRECDTTRDSLMHLCTPGGQDLLHLEIKQLHELCDSSEKEVHERLSVCEARLGELDRRLALRTENLREEVEGLLKELRAQDHALGYCNQHSGISQLQQSWHALKSCEKGLEGLEGKVRDLGSALHTEPSDEELPADIISSVDMVTQMYCSLRSRLSERQTACAENTVQVIREALRSLQQWNQAANTLQDKSTFTIQELLEEGATLRQSLQVALSHKELLRDCLGPELAGKMERDGTQTVKDAEAYMASLTQRLKDIAEQKRREAIRLSQEIELKLQDLSPEQQLPAVAQAECLLEEDENDDEPLGPNMQDLFTQISQLTKDCSSTLPSEDEVYMDLTASLDWSVHEQDSRFKCLVLRVLTCQTRPAELCTEAMSLQLEEAEDCKHSAQREISALSQMIHTNANNSTEANDEGSNLEGHELKTEQELEGQWTAVLWDASAVVHSKETELGLVTDYSRQTQIVKAMLERLRVELESLKTTPQESSFLEAVRLQAFLRSMEQERSILGELLRTLSNLSPRLSDPERASAHTQLQALQVEWHALEHAGERALQHVQNFSRESALLLQEANGLLEHLKTLQRALDPCPPTSLPWDPKKAREAMLLSAELTAAQQHYLHLQQSAEALAHSAVWKAEAGSMERALQAVRDQLELLGDLLAAQTPSSSNPIMAKILKVMTDAQSWAKQTESDIEGRHQKVALLPEEVHRQIKELKRLQSEMSAKQIQLEALVEEASELMPQLDPGDVPMVTASLRVLEGLSKSTAEKLAEALREVELALQTRERLMEQLADVDAWVTGQLQREALRRSDDRSLGPAELERRAQQLQLVLDESERQAATAEALLMNSRDIATELSVTENSLLNDKVLALREDIRRVATYERACSQEVEQLLQGQAEAQCSLAALEKSLRQMLLDMKQQQHFPITRNSLAAVESIRQAVLEHRYQVELLWPCPDDKRRDLLGLITELHHKMAVLDQKAPRHERYLAYQRRVEDLKEDMEASMQLMRDENHGKEERHRHCQAVLTQLAALKVLCEEASEELQQIEPDLYPTQLTTERKRLKHVLDSINTWEMTVHNNLKILEWEQLQGIDYKSECRVVLALLREVHRQLVPPQLLTLSQQEVDRELRRCVVLRRSVENRVHVLEVLELKKSLSAEEKTQKAKVLLCKNLLLSNCDKRLESLSQARKALRSYVSVVTSAILFLQKAETVLLPSLTSAPSCSQRLKDAQQALGSLEQDTHTYVAQLQDVATHVPCFCPDQVQHLHSSLVSLLLVRLATLQAQAQLRMEILEGCVERQKTVRKTYEEICQQVRDAETALSECTAYKITTQQDCNTHRDKLKALTEQVEALSHALEKLREWCPVQGCRSNREEAVSTLWGQVSRLQHCTRDLQARLDIKASDWTNITMSVEKASIVLEQVEAELPEVWAERAAGEELQEQVQYWTQYQERLDCESHALCALELRLARLLGVPPTLEQAPPIPICQELQAMQERYRSLREKSMLGHRAAMAELQEREKVRQELQGVREWLLAAFTLLTALEESSSTRQLQEVQAELRTQKAVLQRIMESLRMKYSDMYTLVPMEIEGPLQEVSSSLQEVEEQVEDAVEKSGPLHRLGAKVTEIRAGLESVQICLQQRSSSITDAENTQKMVWDELDVWHTRVAALEMELQDLSEDCPQEAQLLSHTLADTQRLHTLLTMQAEQRTTQLSKMRVWQQEHEEMVQSSQTWLQEAQSWLTTPYNYTSAKCLYTHITTLQTVLDDSAQIRRTLQDFEGVLKEMAEVCDVTSLRNQLTEADQSVADMQTSFEGPLAQLEHAAAEVDAIESEVKAMEGDVAAIRDVLSPRGSIINIPKETLKDSHTGIEVMKRTIAEIQNCKAGLCLPKGAEHTLTVFAKAEQILLHLLQLEKLIPKQVDDEDTPAPEKAAAPLPTAPEKPPSPLLPAPEKAPSPLLPAPEKAPSPLLPAPEKAPSPLLSMCERPPPKSSPPLERSASRGPRPAAPLPLATQESEEQGHIQIAHVEEDVLKRTGGTLMTVEASSPEQRLTWGREQDIEAKHNTQKSTAKSRGGKFSIFKRKKKSPQ